MNTLEQQHPTQNQLIAFGAGKLAPAESAEIEQHLVGCESCCQMLKMLPSDDTLVALLRDGEEDTSVSPIPDNAPTIELEDPLSPLEQPTIPPGGEATRAISQPDGPALSELPTELREHPRYKLVKLLGRGGMGDVYQAEHRMMNRSVAIKVINRELVQSDMAVQRFHREVEAAARLSHPNIVTAHDAEQAGDAHFLVMEFVEGQELAEVVRQRGPLPVQQACSYIAQAAVGLQHAHDLGMVHRDIKPQNLMLTDDGKIKILDFGLANFASESATQESETEAVDASHEPVPAHLTRLGSMMGTPDYISPEQAKDAHSADIRSDIYSLGCTLYCLLTGEPPFSGGSMMDKVLAHVDSQPKSLSEYRDDVPENVSTVLEKMIAKDPEQRYQTPAEVAQALKPIVVGAQPPAPPFWRRWQTAVAAGVVFLLAAAAAIFHITTNKGRIEIISEVDDVQIVIKQGGEKITTIDLKTGSQVHWLATGNYELQLVGGDNNVELDKTGFRMTRLGRVIVTARFSREGRKVVRSFKASDQPITRNGVVPDDGGWKVTADRTRSVRLFEAKNLQLDPGPFFYRAKLKTEDVQGRAYLEMWVRIPGQGEFFSKGFHNAIGGTNGWSEYEIPFFLKQGQQPDLVKLNLTVEGGGKVWIKDIELRGSAQTDYVPSNEPFLKPNDLVGWKGNLRIWKIQDGTLMGTTTGASRSNAALYSQREYRDFEMHFQVRLKDNKGDGGLIFRGAINDEQNYQVKGPKFAIGGRNWGALHGENISGIFKAAPINKVSKELKRGQFNDCYIRCVGNHITIKLNGTTTVDGEFNIPRTGIIAWQVQRDEPTEIAFRDIRFQELDSYGRPLTPIKETASSDDTIADTDQWLAQLNQFDRQRLGDPGQQWVLQESGAGGIAAAAMLPGNKSALCEYENTLAILDLDSGKITEKFTSPDDDANIRQLAVTPDGKTAITAESSAVRLWDIAARRQTQKVAVPTTNPSALSISPDGILVAIADDSGVVRVLSLPKLEEQKSWKHAAAVLNLTFVNNDQLLSCEKSHDSSTLRMWDVTTGKEIRRYAVATRSHTMALAMLPSGKEFIAAQCNGLLTVRGIDVSDKYVNIPLVEKMPDAPFSAVASLPKSGDLIAGNTNGELLLFRAGKWSFAGMVADHNSAITQILPLADDSSVVALCQQGELRRWRLPVRDKTYALWRVNEFTKSQVFPGPAGRQGTENGHYFIEHLNNPKSGWFGWLKGNYDNGIIEVKARVAEGSQTGWSINLVTSGKNPGLTVDLWRDRILIGPNHFSRDSNKMKPIPLSRRPQKGNEFDTVRLHLRGRTVAVFLNGEAISKPLELPYDITPGVLSLGMYRIPRAKNRVEFDRFAIWLEGDSALATSLKTLPNDSNTTPPATTPKVHPRKNNSDEVMQLAGKSLVWVDLEGDALLMRRVPGVVTAHHGLVVAHIANAKPVRAATIETPSGRRIPAQVIVNQDKLLWLKAEGLNLNLAHIADLATNRQMQMAYQFHWDEGGKLQHLADAKVVRGIITDKMYVGDAMTSFTPANGLPIFNGSGELLGVSAMKQRRSVLLPIRRLPDVAQQKLSDEKRPPAKDANLVHDPSLEASALGAKFPTGWGSYNSRPNGGYRFQVVKGGRTGQQCCLLEGEGIAVTMPVNRVIIDRKKRYAGRAWVKLSGEDAAAHLDFLYFDVSKRYIGGTHIGRVAPREQWQLVKITDQIKDHPKAKYVALAMTLQGKGKALFDDLHLQDFDADSLPQDFDARYGRTLSPEMLVLGRLVGDWDLTRKPETPAGAKEQKVGSLRARWILQDRFVMGEVANAKGEIERLWLKTYDDKKKSYRCWTFDSSGAATPSVMQWSDKLKELVLPYTKAHGSERSQAKSILFESDDSFKLRRFSQDAAGKPLSQTSVVATRRRTPLAKLKLKVERRAQSPAELAVLEKIIGRWSVQTTFNPSVQTTEKTVTNSIDEKSWILGGSFMINRNWDEKGALTSLWLMHYDSSQQRYPMWFFNPHSPGLNVGQWNESEQTMAHTMSELPAGWTARGVNRIVDADTMEATMQIKDDSGKVMLDMQWSKKRLKND